MDCPRIYESVDHVLEVFSQMHAEIAQVVSTLAHQTCDERVKLRLESLADYQSRRANALEAYHQAADATLLKQWFQIAFPEEPVDLLESLRTVPSSEACIDGLISEIDTFMDRLLPHLRDRAETSEVKELFQELLEIETRERLLLSWRQGRAVPPGAGESRADP